MNNFLNTSIKKKKVKFKIKEFKSYWIEINTVKDAKVAAKELLQKP